MCAIKITFNFCCLNYSNILDAFLNAQRPPTTRSPSSVSGAHSSISPNSFPFSAQRTRLQFPNPGQPTETPGDELPRPGAPPAVIPLSEYVHLSRLFWHSMNLPLQVSSAGSCIPRRYWCPPHDAISPSPYWWTWTRRCY